MSKLIKRIKRRLAARKLWRSQAYHRAHQQGYQLALSHYPREQAWIETLEKYYYAHMNNCQETKCEVCKSL